MVINIITIVHYENWILHLLVMSHESPVFLPNYELETVDWCDN